MLYMYKYVDRMWRNGLCFIQHIYTKYHYIIGKYVSCSMLGVPPAYLHV